MRRRLPLLLHTASMHHCTCLATSFAAAQQLLPQHLCLLAPCPSLLLSSTPRQAVEGGAARKAYDLQLPALGPYSLSFTRSGRHMLLAGRKGHLALMDWQRHRLVCEVQVRVGEGRRAAGSWQPGCAAREAAECTSCQGYASSCHLRSRCQQLPPSAAALSPCAPDVRIPAGQGDNPRCLLPAQ